MKTVAELKALIPEQKRLANTLAPSFTFTQPRRPETKEEVLAEELEPEHRKVIRPRKDGKTKPEGWEQRKEDTRDLIPEELPPEIAREALFHTSVENVITNTWAELLAPLVPAQHRYDVGSVLGQKMLPLWKEVAKNWLAGLDLTHWLVDRYPEVTGVRGRSLGMDLLWFKAWRWDLLLEALARLEAIQAEAELPPEVLRNLVEELGTWLPIILTRLEELAAEPGPTSARLQAAIARTRERIPVLEAMWARVAGERTALPTEAAAPV